MYVLIILIFQVCFVNMYMMYAIWFADQFLYLSSGGWWRGSRHPSPVETCANTLTEVNCPSSYHIHFKRATIHSTTSNCDIINTDCASTRLKGLCNEKRSCISDETKTSCLYHKRFARIQYACQGKHDTYLHWFIMLKRQQ